EQEGSNQYQLNKSGKSQGTSRIHRGKQASEEEHQNRQT
ncbi:fras1 related extracellular matrix protein, partial [Schistosoma mansoni]